MRRRTSSDAPTKPDRPVPPGHAGPVDEREPDLAEGTDVYDFTSVDTAARELPPLDVDHLLAAYLLDEKAGAPTVSAPAATVENAHAPKVDLVLFVVSGSKSCRVARATVERVLAGYDSRDVRLTVRNVSGAPLSIDERLITVPALFIQAAGRSRVSMEGDVNPGALADLLVLANVRRVGDK